MKLTKVIIEGMHNVVRKSYELSDLTYLHGPNGAGKSTVMQAIQLALLGYIPGTSKASKEAIFRHANGHVLSVTLLIQDNDRVVTITRVWSGTKSSINSSIEIDPADYDISEVIKDLELPIFNFNEFIGMTANKLKDWFIEFLPSSDMSFDWRKLLYEDAKKVESDIKDTTFIENEINHVNSSPLSGSDLVRFENDHFKSVMSAKKKELERLQSTIQSLIFYDDVDESMTEDEVASQIKTYEMLKSSRESYAKATELNNKIMKQLEVYKDCGSGSFESDAIYLESADNFAKASTAIVEAQNSIVKYKAEIAEIEKERKELLQQFAEINADNATKQSIIDTGGICTFTGKKCDSVQTLFDQYREEIAANEELLKELDSSITACDNKIATLNANIQTLTNKVSEESQNKYDCNIQMSEVKNRYTMYKQLKDQLVIVPDYIEDDRDFDTLISELRDTQNKLSYNKRYNELIDKLTVDKFKLEQELNVYKSWINLTGVNGLQNDNSAIKPFIDLAANMDTYIQAVFGEDVKSKFNLESKANSFSFGIERDNSYIPFNLLSSGEKCMYTLALMLCLIEASSSQLKLVMVDDLLDHLDDINIEKLFESLKKVEGIQMIFAGVKSIDGNYVVEVQN